ncbi:hypothetical protein TWF694_002390 [Orbilia ellipsospora]|uniref:N-acetyltransferase domain-containing protein n=1 Tax=Orbilia ellipsospora TaxID=2528407 RepID=A0AAV9X4D6_9PEZI
MANTIDIASIEIRLTNWLDEDGVALRALQRKEIVIADYREEPGLPPSADDMPVFLVLKLNSIPIACGGLRPLDPDANNKIREAEIKRMFVIPEYRGKRHGVADLLMKHLESQALERGWSTVKLETGKDMESARKFYERHGYKEIPLFGHYIGALNNVCYEKVLLSL